MTTPSPAQLTVTILPDNEYHALYLVQETLERFGISVLDTVRKETRFGTAISPFRTEIRFIFALDKALPAKAIHDIAYTMAIGLIIGVEVRGEIDLETRTIYNLGAL